MPREFPSPLRKEGALSETLSWGREGLGWSLGQLWSPEDHRLPPGAQRPPPAGHSLGPVPAWRTLEGCSQAPANRPGLPAAR